MRTEIEKRLHRVKLNFSSLKGISCNHASLCDKAQKCGDAILFFENVVCLNNLVLNIIIDFENS